MKILFHLLYLPSYVLVRVTFHGVIIFVFPRKGSTVFCKLEEREPCLKFGLIMLNLTIFRGTRPKVQLFEGRLALTRGYILIRVFFSFVQKHFSRIIFSIPFRAPNHQVVDRRN